MKSVNTELVGLYWDIGRMIVERQEKAGWGKAVVERLSSRTYGKNFPDLPVFQFRISGISFDEQPCTERYSEDIDFRAPSELFDAVSGGG